MAKYEVQGPDGGKYEVEMPEGMTPEQMSAELENTFSKLGIKANRVDASPGKFAAPAIAPKYPGMDFAGPVPQVRAAIQAMPEADRKGAFQEWAKQYVANERKGGGFMQGVRDIGRNIARGSSVGSWLDEANAKTAARDGVSYDEALAYQRATDEAIDKDSTKLGSLPLIGDVTAGGIQKLIGGVLSVPFSPMVIVMRGGTMLPRMVNAGATGAVYGAGYGSGEGDSSGERMVNAAVGGGIGLGLGAAMPPIAEGVGRLFNRQARPQGALAPMNRDAVANIADDMRADRVSQIVPDNMMPEAMLADLGPNLQGHAGAIARKPGEGQYIVKDALGETATQGRRGQAPGRIREAMDNALGPPQNLVEAERQFTQQANQASRPYYRQFEETVIPWTPEINALQTRALGAPGVVQQAERLMQVEGVRPPGPDWAVRSGRDWDYIKRAVDDLADAAPYGSNERRVYSNLSRDIRTTIDNMLIADSAAARGVPVEQGVSSWQQARGLAGTGKQFQEGLEQGADAFKRGTHPDQMRADLAGMANRNVQRQGFEMGARGAIRDIMGNQGTAFGPTGDSAAMKALGSDYARDKLRQVAGDQGANTIIDRLGAEARYEMTRQAAVGNSVTAAMQQAMKRLDKTSGLDTALDPSVGMLGTVKQFAKWSINKMSAGYLDERSRAVAVDAARILTAQGPERDAYIRELTSFINRRDITTRRRNAATGLLEAIGAGARAPAIENASIGGESRP